MLVGDFFHYHTEADSGGGGLPVVCGAMLGIGPKCKVLRIFHECARLD